jgi:hypothetical protein
MGEGLLIQRLRPDRATLHPHLTPSPELRRLHDSTTALPQ